VTADTSELARSTGEVSEGFEDVRREFDRLVNEVRGFSGQLNAYWRGHKVVDLVAGQDSARRSLAGVCSVSKGVSALAISLLVQAGSLDLDRRVADYWPEFFAASKESITVRELLTHEAGLLGTIEGLTLSEYCHSELAAAKLAASPTCWRCGSMFGYHGLTIGVFMEELTRRIDGRSLQQLYADDIRIPYGIDFYLGVPAHDERRVRPILPPLDEENTSATPHDGLDVFGMGIGIKGGGTKDKPEYLTNDPDVRRAGPATFGGVGSAEGLARLYAASITSIDGKEPFLLPSTVAKMSQEQVWGLDRVLNVQMCFGIVFMKAQPRMEFASYRGFGHDGAGGALGYADPQYELGFGYIPQRMSPSDDFVRLSQAVRQAITVLTG
jgi:CubicO group peptidase (beta-lactamase class C family)